MGGHSLKSATRQEAIHDHVNISISALTPFFFGELHAPNTAATFSTQWLII